LNSHTLQRFFPFLAWPRPNADLLRGDVFAGLTVGLMVIPQGVAYAALAGMPLVTGIYAALFPALVAVLWGSSTRLSVGPTALTCLLVSASLAGLAAPGSAEWVMLAVWLALLSGGLQLCMGVGKFGWLLNLVSSPVLTGFTQAAGILIVASQLPALMGFKGPLKNLLDGPPINLTAGLFGLVSLAALVLGKRLWPRAPLMMLVVALAGLVSYVIGFEQAGGAVVGQLPAGLPAFFVPSWLPWPVLAQLLVPAMVIALISFLETASSAKVENQQSGTRWNDNQDLIGQGVAKLASALSGSFPSSASFSRSAIMLYSGARSGWATIAAVLLVFVVLLWFMPLLHSVPQSVLAAVVVVAVASLIKPSVLLGLWRISPVEAITAATTFVLTLATAPRMYWGVLAGLLMSLSHFLYLRLHPRIIEVGLHADGSLRDRHLWSLPPLAPSVYALRMDAELDFASANGFGLAIATHLAAHPEVKHVCLFAQPINRVDVTGVEAFVQMQNSLNLNGIALHISGIKLPVERALTKARALMPNPLLHLYRTDAEALQALRSVNPQP
jgi:sulfate permease, SulP family